MKKITFAAGIEYEGTNYYGWQIQKNLLTVQGELEKVLSIIANSEVKITCAGRTDKGVHSIGQVIHFRTFSIRKEEDWILGANSLLPRSISVCWVKKVSNYFHARYSALWRWYRYVIYNSTVRSALLRNNVFFYCDFLHVIDMYHAAQYLIGEHDFTSFRASTCQSISPFRKIMKINVFRKNFLVVVDIIANSFLHHMVRNIVGSLIIVGTRKKSKSWMKRVLIKKNRQLSGFTAGASGLYLVYVKYSNIFKIDNFFFPFFKDFNDTI